MKEILDYHENESLIRMAFMKEMNLFADFSLTVLGTPPVRNRNI